jgi:uncharacterized membrane protein YeiH
MKEIILALVIVGLAAYCGMGAYQAMEYELQKREAQVASIFQE